MKMLAAGILICLTLSARPASTAVLLDTCSCSADDNSCAVSISCNGGCVSFCPSNGCRAMCVSDSEPGTQQDGLRMPVSIHFKGSNSREVSTELARITGKDVAFFPFTAGATFDLNMDEVPLWNVLEILAQSGRIQIAQDDFSNLRAVRRAFLQGERISTCIHGVTVKRLIEELEYLTGLDIRITSGNQKTIVSYTGKGVNLNEIIAQISEQTSVQIAIK